jgi:hypothetical protein
LEERFQYTSYKPDLASAVEHGQRALELCQAEDMLCPTVLSFYARIWNANVSHPSDITGRQVAENLCSTAISGYASEHPARAAAHHILGWIKFRLFEATGTPTYLEEAYDLQQIALKQLYPSQYHEKHRHLHRLSVYSRRRYIRFGNPLDLEDAMTFIAEATQLCPSRHVDRFALIHARIYVLRHAFDCSGGTRVENLDEALNLGRQALALPNACGQKRSYVLSIVAGILATQDPSPAHDHLEETVALSREAVACSSSDHMDYWMFLAGLAIALLRRFDDRGNLSDLEESIELYRGATDILAEGHPARTNVLSNLSETLGHRFYQTGDLDDLSAALELDRKAMKAIESSNAEQYYRVHIVTIRHLCDHYEVTGAEDDPEEAIMLSENLLQGTIPSAASRHAVMVYTLLSKALLLRGKYKSLLTDLNQAIQTITPLKRELLRSRIGPEGLRILSSCHLARFCQVKDVKDAIIARDLIDELLNSLVPGWQERYQCLLDAAILYMEIDTPYHSVPVALNRLEDALLYNYRDVRSRIQGAKNLLDIWEVQHKSIFAPASSTALRLLKIYASATALLPRIAFVVLHHHARLQSLAAGQSIALRGASHALNLSLPKQAIEILEQGRAIFWTNTLQLRSSFDTVPTGLREQLLSLAQQLGRASETLEPAQNVQLAEAAAARRRQQAEEFNSLVEQVRRLPTLERFLLHDEFSALAKAAENGPVVVLVSTTLGCHAIAIRSSGDAIGIPLEPISESWLVESGSVWRSAVNEARSIVRDDRKMVKATSSKTSRTSSTKEKTFSAVCGQMSWGPFSASWV